MKSISSSLTEIVDTPDHEPSASSLNVVPLVEAESIVQSLQQFKLHEIGCSPFMQMYAYDVERLSIQAHISAKRRDGDEYVVESILSNNKLETLVRTMLTIEAWRTKVLEAKMDQDEKETEPGACLLEKLASNKSSLRCAFILHVETTLCSLINLILYRKEYAEEMDGDVAVSLVDYCARQMSSLVAPLASNPMMQKQRNPGTSQEAARYIQNRSILQEMRDNILENEFKTAVVATSLSRHLCEHIESLPVSAQTRILDTHDFLQLMIPLIDGPPWTRRREQVQSISGSSSDADEQQKSSVFVWEKFIDNAWVVVPPSELLQVTQYEAQCWIAVFHLTCTNLCRERYAMNAFRKEQLLRLRKYLNEVMIEQLPILTDVMRYMDELSLMNVPEAATGQGSALLMQQVDCIREDITGSNTNYYKVGQSLFLSIFSKCTDAQDQDLRLIAGIYSEDNIGSYFDGSMEGTNDIPIVLPVSYITIEIKENDNMYVLANLTMTGDSTTVESECGKATQIKMKVHRETSGLIEQSDVLLRAQFSSENMHNFKMLELNTSFSSKTTSIQWIQLGKIELDGYALQLGFKARGIDDRLEEFSLRQAFLSTSLK